MSSPEHFWSSQNYEDVGLFGSVEGGPSLLLAIPAWLWRLYVEYLWKWDAHPWIVSAAATFQLFAVLVVAPFALLSLLDVGAYVIARTLGVVETTRASTSDSKHERDAYPDTYGSDADLAMPPIQVDDARSSDTRHSPSVAEDIDAPSPLVDSISSTSRSKQRFDANLKIPIPHARYTHFGRGMRGDGTEAEAFFFSPSDERQLELSGALLSSPTPSRQASPALDRRHRLQPLTAERLQLYETTPSASSEASSTAESEQFTMLEPSELDRTEEFEGDDTTTNSPEILRRRAGRNETVAV